MKIAVDFDGTVVDHRWPEVGPDVPHAVGTMRALVAAGHKLFLNTMRSGGPLEDAVQWFKDREVELAGVGRDPEQDSWTTSPKCYAEVYIDDAAFGCPLRTIPGFRVECVDWAVVRSYFLEPDA